MNTAKPKRSKKRLTILVACACLFLGVVLYLREYRFSRPIGSGPAGPSVHMDPYYWFYDNVEDPNDRGYDAIRRAFLNTIIENTSLTKTP